jgi:hypothetical protein
VQDEWNVTLSQVMAQGITIWLPGRNQAPHLTAILLDMTDRRRGESGL